MNENLEKDKIQLGNEKPQLLPSKSLLNTIKLGYDTKPVPPPPENHINFIEGDSVMTTISTGFEHNDKPVPPPPEINLSCKTPKHKNPDSVIGSVDTGFGCDNQLIRECPKPKYKTHLCKENYLGEFKTESEKTLARTNLGVYSKEEIDRIVGQIVENNNNNFITKKEVQNMIADLDFVDSTLKSYVDYQIPNNLFNYEYNTNKKIISIKN